jgi:hypothetical protein
MILRGAQIHWDGDGKCGILPNSTLSSNKAQLLSSGVFANTWMSLGNSIVSHRHFTPEVQHMSESKDQKPFLVTRSRYRAVRLPRA